MHVSVLVRQWYCVTLKRMRIESNPDCGLISFNSPLAKQLLGREEGDEVNAKLPSGVKTFEILEVKYQEIVFETH